MSTLFADLPEALENNYNFPFRCNFRPLFSSPILPNISSEKGGNADDILRKDSLYGLKIKFDKIFKIKNNELDNNKIFLEYKDRLDHELSIIIEMKYASYFLIVSDYIKWAKNNDIGLFQFSVENANNVKNLILFLIDCLIILSTVFNPALCPAFLEFLCFNPHLPLPSIIMAT